MCVFCVFSADRKHKGRQYVGCNSGNWYSWNTTHAVTSHFTHKHIHSQTSVQLFAYSIWNKQHFYFLKNVSSIWLRVCACMCVFKCVSACLCMYFIRITHQRIAWWLISDTPFPPLSSLFTSSLFLYFSPQNCRLLRRPVTHWLHLHLPQYEDTDMSKTILRVRKLKHRFLIRHTL